MDEPEGGEELETEGLPRPPVESVKKIVRSFRLSEEITGTIRQLAAINGISLSEALSRLLRLGFNQRDYPDLPPDTVLIMKDKVPMRSGSYLIPIDIDQEICELMAGGYSFRYLIESSIRKGLIRAKSRRHSQDRPTMGSRAVPPVAQAERPGAAVLQDSTTLDLRDEGDDPATR